MCNICSELYLFVHLLCILEMLFWQFHLIMQVTANVFSQQQFTGFAGDTSAVAVTEGLATSSHCSLLCQCLLFVGLGGQNEPSLS